MQIGAIQDFLELKAVIGSAQPDRRPRVVMGSIDHRPSTRDIHKLSARKALKGKTVG